MEIKHPRRILVLGTPDCDISRVVKDLTGSAPQPDSATGSLAGVTHEWTLKTAYYSTAIPIWIDQVTDIAQWKAEFLKSEAKEVVEAVGAWIYCFSGPKKEKQGTEVDIDEQVEETLKAISEVIDAACGMDWDGTRLAIDMTASNQGKTTVVAEEQCLDCGFEYIHVDAEGKNEYGEKLGLERAREALEANEWSAGFDDEDEQEDNIGDFDNEQAQMNAELWGMKASLLDPENDEDEDSALQVEGMEQMMSQLLAIRETTAGMPENERKRFAARAVDDLMKNF